MLRCSSSSRVDSGPSVVNSKETSLARDMSGLYFQSLCRFQENTIRFGGSQTSTLPQSHSCPSAERSNQRPPAYGSTTISAKGAWPMWWVAGHQACIFSVSTRNARSMGTATCRVFFNAVAVAAGGSGVMLVLLFKFVFRNFLKSRQSLVPKLREVVP